MPSIEPIETERLILRPLTEGDAGFIFDLVNDPSFIQYIGDRNVRTLDDAKRYITSGPIASYVKNGFGLYRVELKETGEPIGMCGLIRRSMLNDVDIGYAYLPRYWSKGYAIEAALAMKQYAREVIGLKRMVAVVDPQNTGSIRLLEKLGMTFERMVKLAEDDIELKLFSIDL